MEKKQENRVKVLRIVLTLMVVIGCAYIGVKFYQRNQEKQEYKQELTEATKIKETLDSKEQTVKDLKKEVETKEDKVTNDKTEIESKEKQIAEKEKELKALEEEVNKLKEIEKLKQRLAELKGE